MLDLQSRIHFKEIEVLVLVDDELHRAGALIVHGLCQGHRLLAHGAPRLLVQEGRRRLLHHLLVAALDGAFALAEIDGVAVRVGQDLDLDVPGLDHELLDEDAVVAEGAFRLRAGALEAVAHLRLRPGDAHALAAAAGGGLDHHRIADLVGDPLRLIDILDDTDIAGDRRDRRRVGEFLRFDLVAHRLDGLDVRADEGDARLFERDGEFRVLRQKAVARMHSLRARLPAGVYDPVDDEIGLGCRRLADMNGLVRHLDMERVLVGVGIDGHRLDAHPLRGLHHPAGDLATVGDQDFLEHGIALRVECCRASSRVFPAPCGEGARARGQYAAASNAA